MKNAGSVIVVPGYGLAVAQAQHALLHAVKGRVSVRYVTTVAGRARRQPPSTASAFAVRSPPGGGRCGPPGPGDRVEQPPVVDHAAVAHGDHVDARGVELPGVFLALVAQHVVAPPSDQRRRQPAELLGRRPQGRGVGARPARGVVV